MRSRAAAVLQRGEMYSSSYDNMRFCIRSTVLRHERLATSTDRSVLVVGDVSEPDEYRELFEAIGCTYEHLDVSAATSLSAADRSVDIVVGGPAFARHRAFWRLFGEMNRVVAEDGLIVLIVPSCASPRRSPSDLFTFSAEGLRALATDNGTNLIESRSDRRGPVSVVTGVFSRQGGVDTGAPFPADDVLGPRVQNDFPAEVNPDHEIRSGAEPSLDFIARVHDHLQPRSYLEVGVFTGFSLALSRCPSIGIDPYPQLDTTLNADTVVKEMTSDDFFLLEDVPPSMRPVDLAYIDGLHLIENVLKDFMNVERSASSGSVILVDDVFPNHLVQGSRRRVSQNWTGDVWKIMEILRVHRPDLLLVPVDTEPTGTLVVIGADPTNDVLWDRYDDILDWAILTLDEPPMSTIERTDALDPRDPLLARLFERVRMTRTDPRPSIAGECREMIADATPRMIAGER